MEDRDALLARAYHEAAHALVGYVLRNPRLVCVTTEPDGQGSSGHCLREEWPPYLEIMPWIAPEMDLLRAKEVAGRHADVRPLDEKAVRNDRLERDICSRLAGLEGALLVQPSYNRALASNDLCWAHEHADQVTSDPEKRRKLIDRLRRRARRILRGHRYALDVLARTLFERRTLEGREVEDILDAAIACERIMGRS